MKLFSLAGKRNFDATCKCLASVTRQFPNARIYLLDDGTLSEEHGERLQHACTGRLCMNWAEDVNPMIEFKLKDYPSLRECRRKFMLLRKITDPFLLAEDEGIVNFLDSDIYMRAPIKGLFLEPSELPQIRFMAQLWTEGKLTTVSRRVERLNSGFYSYNIRLDLAFFESLIKHELANTGGTSWHFEQACWMAYAATLQRVKLASPRTIAIPLVHSRLRKYKKFLRFAKYRYEKRWSRLNIPAIHYVGSSFNALGEPPSGNQSATAEFVEAKVQSSFEDASKFRRGLGYLMGAIGTS